MKTLTATLALLLLCTGAIKPTKYDVVIFECRATQYRIDVGDPQLCGNGFVYGGYDIYNCSASSNSDIHVELPVTWLTCPPPGYSNNTSTLSQLMADLLDRGYEVKAIDTQGLRWQAIRAR
jgi:hypothetical protein